MTESYYRTATSQSTNNECLSDYQLTALIDDSLPSLEKHTLIKHINRCSDCRFCWMEATINITHTDLITDNTGWYDRLCKILSIDFIPPKITSGIVVMTSVIICAVLLFPLQKNVESLLDDQYLLLTAQENSTHSKIIMNMSLPWEQTNFGFAPTDTDISEIAFAAGLMDGRMTLSDESLPPSLSTKQNSSWNETKQQVYYQFGRWMNSLWLISQLENKVDWNKQSIIMQQFKRDFHNQNQEQNTKIYKALQGIDIALKDIQITPYAKDDLLRQVERVVINLSPHSLN